MAPGRVRGPCGRAAGSRSALCRWPLARPQWRLVGAVATARAPAPPTPLPLPTGPRRQRQRGDAYTHQLCCSGGRTTQQTIRRRAEGGPHRGRPSAQQPPGKARTVRAPGPQPRPRRSATPNTWRGAGAGARAAAQNLGVRRQRQRGLQSSTSEGKKAKDCRRCRCHRLTPWACSRTPRGGGGRPRPCTRPQSQRTAGRPRGQTSSTRRSRALWGFGRVGWGRVRRGLSGRGEGAGAAPSTVCGGPARRLPHAARPPPAARLRCPPRTRALHEREQRGWQVLNRRAAGVVIHKTDDAAGLQDAARLRHKGLQRGPGALVGDELEGHHVPGPVGVARSLGEAVLKGYAPPARQRVLPGFGLGVQGDWVRQRVRGDRGRRLLTCWEVADPLPCHLSMRPPSSQPAAPPHRCSSSATARK
jgi:hypothetical protein